MFCSVLLYASNNRAGEAGAGAHRRATVAQALRLHGLPLATVGDRIDEEVTPHGVDLHEVVLGGSHDAAVPVKLGIVPEDPRRLPAVREGS